MTYERLGFTMGTHSNMSRPPRRKNLTYAPTIKFSGQAKNCATLRLFLPVVLTKQGIITENRSERTGVSFYEAIITCPALTPGIGRYGGRGRRANRPRAHSRVPLERVPT